MNQEGQETNNVLLEILSTRLMLNFVINRQKACSTLSFSNKEVTVQEVKTKMSQNNSMISVSWKKGFFKKSR
jgi:hypothetical protein